jgi:hypothetical protein
MAHEVWFWEKSLSGRWPGPLSLALRMQSSARAPR